MNVIALTTGVVHAPNGNSTRTKCKVRIRSRWQPTEAELTCPACIVRVYGTPPPDPPIEPPQPTVETTPIVEPAKPLTTAEMLDQLDCFIADELLIIQVVPGKPEATVTIRKSELRAWCERRLAARAAHKNKCVRGGSGPPSLGTIHLM